MPTKIGNEFVVNKDILRSHRHPHVTVIKDKNIAVAIIITPNHLLILSPSFFMKFNF